VSILYFKVIYILSGEIKMSFIDRLRAIHERGPEDPPRIGEYYDQKSEYTNDNVRNLASRRSDREGLTFEQPEERIDYRERIQNKYRDKEEDKYINQFRKRELEEKALHKKANEHFAGMEADLKAKGIDLKKFEPHDETEAEILARKKRDYRELKKEAESLDSKNYTSRKRELQQMVGKYRKFPKTEKQDGDIHFKGGSLQEYDANRRGNINRDLTIEEQRRYNELRRKANDSLGTSQEYARVSELGEFVSKVNDSHHRLKGGYAGYINSLGGVMIGSKGLRGRGGSLDEYDANRRGLIKRELTADEKREFAKLKKEANAAPDGSADQYKKIRRLGQFVQRVNDNEEGMMAFGGTARRGPEVSDTIPLRNGSYTISGGGDPRRKLINYEGFMRPSEKAYVKEKYEKVKNYISDLDIHGNKNFTDAERERIRQKINSAHMGFEVSAEDMARVKNKNELKKFYDLHKSAFKAADKVNLHSENQGLLDEYLEGAEIGGYKTNREKFFNPILGSLSEKMRGGEESLTQNKITQGVKSLLNSASDSSMIKKGAHEDDVIQLRLLEDRYDQAKYNNDTGLQREIGLEITFLKSKINKKILTNKRLEEAELREIRKDQLAVKKLERELANLGGPKSKKEYIPARYKQDMLRPTGLSVLPNYPISQRATDIRKHGFQAGFGRPNISFNKAAGNRELLFLTPEERIARKYQISQMEMMMQKQREIDRDAALSETFMKNGNLKNAVNGRGALPGTNFNVLAGVRQSGFNSMLPITKIQTVSVINPRIAGNINAKPRKPSVAVKNKRATPSLPIKNNIINVAGIGAIHSGIAGMVAPFKTRAQTGKDKVFHSPVCAIANIGNCTKQIGTNHVNRNFGIGATGMKGFNLNVKIPKPNISIGAPNLNAVVMKKKKSKK